MTIEVHRPELEALIAQRMATGRYRDVEEVLLHALNLSEPDALAAPAPAKKPSFAQFMLDSPLYRSEVEFVRQQDPPRTVDFD